MAGRNPFRNFYNRTRAYFRNEKAQSNSKANRRNELELDDIAQKNTTYNMNPITEIRQAGNKEIKIKLYRAALVNTQLSLKKCLPIINELFRENTKDIPPGLKAELLDIYAERFNNELQPFKRDVDNLLALAELKRNLEKPEFKLTSEYLKQAQIDAETTNKFATMTNSADIIAEINHKMISVANTYNIPEINIFNTNKLAMLKTQIANASVKCQDLKEVSQRTGLAENIYGEAYNYFSKNSTQTGSAIDYIKQIAQAEVVPLTQSQKQSEAIRELIHTQRDFRNQMKAFVKDVKINTDSLRIILAENNITAADNNWQKFNTLMQPYISLSEDKFLDNAGNPENLSADIKKTILDIRTAFSQLDTNGANYLSAINNNIEIANLLNTPLLQNDNKLDQLVKRINSETIKPMQRLLKFELLLKEIDKNISEDDMESRKYLRESMDICINIAKEANELIRSNQSKSNLEKAKLKVNQAYDELKKYGTEPNHPHSRLKKWDQIINILDELSKSNDQKAKILYLEIMLSDPIISKHINRAKKNDDDHPELYKKIKSLKDAYTEEDTLHKQMGQKNRDKIDEVRIKVNDIVNNLDNFAKNQAAQDTSENTTPEAKLAIFFATNIPWQKISDAKTSTEKLETITAYLTGLKIPESKEQQGIFSNSLDSAQIANIIVFSSQLSDLAEAYKELSILENTEAERRTRTKYATVPPKDIETTTEAKEATEANKQSTPPSVTVTKKTKTTPTRINIEDKQDFALLGSKAQTIWDDISQSGGVIRSAYDLTTGKKVAVKKVRLEESNSPIHTQTATKPSVLDERLKEKLDNARKVIDFHKNILQKKPALDDLIVHIHGAMRTQESKKSENTTKTTAYQFMEHMDLGSGEKLVALIPNAGLTEAEKSSLYLYITDQILKIVATLNNEEIYHRDLKPANFLFSSDGSIKVTDFDSAAYGSGANYHHLDSGTDVDYHPPEYAINADPSLLGEDMELKADSWSAGLTLFRMYGGNLGEYSAWHSKNYNDGKTYQPSFNLLNLTTPPVESEELRKTLVSLLQVGKPLLTPDPAKRQSAQEVYTSFKQSLGKQVPEKIEMEAIFQKLAHANSNIITSEKSVTPVYLPNPHLPEHDSTSKISASLTTFNRDVPHVPNDVKPVTLRTDPAIQARLDKILVMLSEAITRIQKDLENQNKETLSPTDKTPDHHHPRSL